MAVFERIDLALVQELLEAATGGAELRTVTFENQVVGKTTVPDARVSARFTWWFETKTTRGGYATEGHDREQLRQHTHQLRGDPHARLFVLTPDPTRPTWFDDPDGVDESVHHQILWLSFRDLADAMSAVVADPGRLIGERARFLLAELVALYETDGLLTNDDTVIVAARAAWPEYLAIGVYVCQADRVFREGLTHLGFYAEGAIQPLIARIRAHYSAVPFTRDEALQRRLAGDSELADLIDQQLDQGTRAEGDSHGVLLLSGAHDPDTIPLSQRIENDTRTASGRSWGWTLSQRYTSLERLKSGVCRTSEL
jgi:hypothetical protein